MADDAGMFLVDPGASGLDNRKIGPNCRLAQCSACIRSQRSERRRGTRRIKASEFPAPFLELDAAPILDAQQ